MKLPVGTTVNFTVGLSNREFYGWLLYRKRGLRFTVGHVSRLSKLNRKMAAAGVLVKDGQVQKARGNKDILDKKRVRERVGQNFS